ncbi:hypothetical protein [Amycolatopsis sp. 195334CR]|uniref:hypothetical protein n=1 Tax=Amycolatopsis sp. 195334CR TaxID=2814588 RepID=UPI001A8D9CAD|nr:hypothetical protein [Amycolatopsis sp. 195334CR]MBN6034043.1 hypothetical protein [Amycolatopsis sp. 195334CR]
MDHQDLCAFVDTNLGIDEARARYASRGPWQIARKRTPEESWMTLLDVGGTAIAAPMEVTADREALLVRGTPAGHLLLLAKWQLWLA